MMISRRILIAGAAALSLAGCATGGTSGGPNPLLGRWVLDEPANPTPAERDAYRRARAELGSVVEFRATEAQIGGRSAQVSYRVAGNRVMVSDMMGSGTELIVDGNIANASLPDVDGPIRVRLRRE